LRYDRLQAAKPHEKAFGMVLRQCRPARPGAAVPSKARAAAPMGLATLWT